LIKYDSAPANIIGGYRFPGAPVVDLSPIEPTSKLSPRMGVVSSTVVIGDGLDISKFLRRTVAATKPQAAERN
jgi:hypothetical protein